jgi:hypothetical protein
MVAAACGAPATSSFGGPHVGSAQGRGQARLSAFTFVELLTVIVCLALLAGILHPSLQEAIGKSRHLTCLDRLHKIGQASLTYSEYDSTHAAIPVHRLQTRQDPSNPTFIGAYEWGGKSGIGSDTYVAVFAGYPDGLGSKYGTMAGFGPGGRPLNKIIYPSGLVDVKGLPFGSSGTVRQAAVLDTKLELDAFRCPADDGPPGGAHCRDWLEHPRRSSFDHFGNSYASNMFMVAWSGGEPMLSNSPYLRPLSRVPNPGRTLAYEENIGRWAWAAFNEIPDCQWVGRGVDPGPTKAVRGWHGRDWTYTRSFVDGHAATQKVYIEGTEDADGYAVHYRNEQLPCYPELVCPFDPNQEIPCIPGSQGFQAMRCIIVRGDGWQKDALPAPPICTGLYAPYEGRPSYEGCVFAGDLSQSRSSQSGTK